VKIGIGVTTYKRKDILDITLMNIYKTTNRPFSLYVAEDTDLDRRGISYRKNECLVNLKDCDYIFLFDDDCYPKKENWVDFFVQAHKISGENHFNYLKKELHHKKKTDFYLDWCISSYEKCGGVFMSITQKALKTVGGFYTGYDTYGFEHIGFSNRVYNAKLNSDVFLSVDGSEDYLFAFDYEVKGFKSSITESEKELYQEKNKRLYKDDVLKQYQNIL
jgi:hypothetical protein